MGRFEPVQQLQRKMLQRPADGCVWQFSEWHPEIAVPGELGIERDGPEAGDLQSVRRCALPVKERPDGVAVAAVVAAHVLDVAEDAVRSLRQSRHRARDHAACDLGRNRHQQERGPRAEKIGVLDGPLGARRQIEHQQIEGSPLERTEDLAEERELPGGAPRMGLAARRALEFERLRLRDQRAHREDPDPARSSAGARPCRCQGRTRRPEHLPCAPVTGH